MRVHKWMIVTVPGPLSKVGYMNQCVYIVILGTQRAFRWFRPAFGQENLGHTNVQQIGPIIDAFWLSIASQTHKALELPWTIAQYPR